MTTTIMPIKEIRLQIDPEEEEKLGILRDSYIIPSEGTKLSGRKESPSN